MKLGIAILGFASLISSAASAAVTVHSGTIDHDFFFSIGNPYPLDTGWGRYSIEAFFSVPTAIEEVRYFRTDNYLFDGGFDNSDSIKTRDIVTTHANPRDPNSLLSISFQRPHVGSTVVGRGIIYESGGIQLSVAFDPNAGPVTYRVVERYYAEVPEPETWAMMIGGFGLLGETVRRRKIAFA